jgi:hypothetical protein
MILKFIKEARIPNRLFRGVNKQIDSHLESPAVSMSEFISAERGVAFASISHLS